MVSPTAWPWNRSKDWIWSNVICDQNLAASCANRSGRRNQAPCTARHEDTMPKGSRLVNAWLVQEFHGLTPLPVLRWDRFWDMGVLITGWRVALKAFAARFSAAQQL
jgi:hypothetical protein